MSLNAYKNKNVSFDVRDGFRLRGDFNGVPCSILHLPLESYDSTTKTVTLKMTIEAAVELTKLINAALSTT